MTKTTLRAHVIVLSIIGLIALITVGGVYTNGLIPAVIGSIALVVVIYGMLWSLVKYLVLEDAGLDRWIDNKQRQWRRNKEERVAERGY